VLAAAGGGIAVNDLYRWQRRLASGELGEDPSRPETWVKDALHDAAMAERAAGDRPATSDRVNGTGEPDSEPSQAPAWPEADPAAFYGLAGDVVRRIEPTSEADPLALLVHFLVAFGSACGRGPYFPVESTRHHLNIFALVIGRSSRGRKGTAQQNVWRPMTEADATWATTRVLSGLSSGEGLIWAVRDPIYKTVPIREGKRVVGHEPQLEDPGVTDKRLCIIEPEFGSTLRVLKRDGSTLSATVRQAWDGSDLRVLTKNSAAVASGPHISILGHVTQDEFRRELDRVELANGFINRFLLVCVRRSKELPEGGAPDPVTMRLLANDIGLALDFARSAGELRRDAAARGLWLEVYSDLTADRPGLLGAITARGEAQVTRLSCLYAVLDRSATIRPEHLEAALALWRYCEDSARYLFGDSTGDPVADEIYRALTSATEGLTRKEIRDLFSRNRSKEELDRALATLERFGLASQREDSGGPGRPIERWVRSFRSFKSSASGETETGAEQRNRSSETFKSSPATDAQSEEIPTSYYDINDLTPIRTNDASPYAYDLNDSNDLSPGPADSAPELEPEYLEAMLADDRGDGAQEGAQ
jgi:hypothetical protein